MAKISYASAVILEQSDVSIAGAFPSNAEGQSGGTSYTFTATRTGDTSAAQTANWAVTGSGDNPAAAADFVGGVLPSGTVSFAAGETSKTIAVEVAGDATVEADEGFTVTLSNPSAGLVIGTAAASSTIVNDDTSVSLILTPSDGAVGDHFGRSVSLSADGLTAILGGFGDDVGANADQGSARVFAWNGSAWMQRGEALTPSDGAAGDHFGYSVSLSADGLTAILGGWADDVGSNAEQGSARVFAWNGSAWVQRGEALTPSDADAGDVFGISVSLSADGLTAIVGGDADDVGANARQGSARVFAWNGSAWEQRGGALTLSDGAAGDHFGRSVSLSADGLSAIVGDWADSVGANGGQGSARVFAWNGSAWEQRGEALTPSDGSAGAHFGYSVSLSADGLTAILGGAWDDVGANAEQGSARVFAWNGSAWEQRGEALTPIDAAAGDNFGSSVSLSADGLTAIVGGDADDVGANIDQGSARVFAWNGSAWEQRGGVLTPSDGAAGDNNFGSSVSLSADGLTAIVGGFGDDVGANWNQGSARVFAWNGTTWVEGGPASAVHIAATSASQAEGNTDTTNYTFTATRTGDTSAEHTVAWAVTGSGTNAAVAADFVGAALPTGTVSFGIGETSKTITIEVAGDGSVESDEGFTVTLGNPTAGLILGAASATGTIVNDDVADRPTEGADTLAGTPNADTLEGFGGDDNLLGLDGNDTLDGGAGADTLVGGDGVDWLSYASATVGVTVDLGQGIAREGGSSDAALSFSTSTSISAASDGFSFAVADFNGDGAVDVAAQSGVGITIRFNDGTGAFGSELAVQVPNRWGWIEAADIDGDGDTDLLAPASTGFTVLRNNGSGQFAALGSNVVPGGFVSLEIGDINGDGLKDVIASTHPHAGIYVFKNTGDATFGAPDIIMADTGYGGYEIGLGDLDGDNDLDMVVGAELPNKIVYLNGGSGSFVRSSTFSVTPGGYVYNFAVGDLNGDGISDVALANTFANNVGVRLGTGDGTFGAETVFATGSFARWVSIADINADSHKDLIIANEFSNSISILTGNGDGTFNPKQDFSAGNTSPFRAVTADINGDQQPDLIFGSNHIGALINTTPVSIERIEGFEAVIGSAFNDALTGSGLADTLDGGAGADTLAGGNGDDTYVVDDAGDLVIEQAGGGTDSVQAVITHTLAAEVENLILTGSAAINGTGNALPNHITGNSAANLLVGEAGHDTLEGGTGADTLAGGNGNDIYYVDDIDDQVIEFAAGGTDVVLAAITQTLAAEVENLILIGSAAVDGTGNVLANRITGNGANNVISGDLGADTLDGNEGDDELRGGAGADRLIGGTGNDLLEGGDGSDRLDGGLGDDTLVGGAGWDVLQLRGDVAGYAATISGDSGTVSGSEIGTDVVSGFEEILGGAGDDIVSVTSVTRDGLWFVGNEGADTLIGPSSTDSSLVAEYGHLTASIVASFATGLVQDGTGSVDQLVNITHIGAGAGADSLVGSGRSERFVGRAGADSIDGAGGTDQVRYNFSPSGVVVDLGAGTAQDGYGSVDWLNSIEDVSGSNFGDTLIGTGGSNWLQPNAGNDLVIGLGGTDGVHYSSWSTAGLVAVQGVVVSLATGLAIDQWGGSDTLISIEDVAGSGFGDTITGSLGQNTIRPGAGADLIDGGAGADRVEYTDSALPIVTERGVLVNLDTGLAIDPWGSTDTLISIERATGTEFADTLIGNAEPNRFNGRGGNDSIVGGTGGDWAEYSNARTGVVVDLGAGTATDGEGGTDTLLGMKHVIGSSQADDLRSDGFAEAISQLRGGRGNDTLRAGGDEVTVVNYADQAEGMLVNLGSATVSSATLGTDSLVGIRGAVMWGVFDDTLLGTARDEWFAPERGADSIVGGAGRDVLLYWDATSGIVADLGAGRATDDGGGQDSFSGMEGLATPWTADSLRGSSGNDTIDPGAGADTVDALGGQDRLDYGLFFSNTSASFQSDGSGSRSAILGVNVDLAAGIAFDIGGARDVVTGFEDASGNTGADTLSGSATANNLNGRFGNDLLRGQAGNDFLEGDAGADTLDGGSGADTMAGGADNDVYIVDDANDRVVETAGNGTDLVQSSSAYVLGAEVENLILTGTATISGTGNALANHITGNSAANRLFGEAGHDTLDGGAGADTLTGGNGNDVYVVDNIGDRVVELAGGGIDAVQAGGAHTLAAEVENLVLTGSDAINGTGNALANHIAGNSAANLLDGGAGADTLAGGEGDDIFVVDNIGDRVVELANGGTDTVRTAIAHTLAAEVENLVLTGTAAVNGTGNALANHITGNSAANLLDGGAGADTFMGGNGNDTYVVDDAGDQVVELSGGGIDLVQSQISWVLGAQVENLLLTGTAAINGTGNALANRITGNSANNLLDGGSGADTLTGGNGDDTYVVDNLGDRIVELAGGGTDLVQTSLSYTLVGDVENLVLTGTSTINGTGSALANYIGGNSANNRLVGNGGDDTLMGAGGRDILTGGLGADLFAYGAVTDSGVTPNRWDIIMDFSAAQGDRIDLSAMDANSSLDGNQAFSFIGLLDFSPGDAGGQLRFEYDDELRATFLYASTDADDDPEFAVLLRSISSISENDIIL